MTVEQLCKALPDDLGLTLQDMNLDHRLKTEAMYEMYIADQLEEIEEIRRDESLQIPDSVDYTA